MLGHNVRAVSGFHSRTYKQKCSEKSGVRLLSRALTIIYCECPSDNIREVGNCDSQMKAVPVTISGRLGTVIVR